MKNLSDDSLRNSSTHDDQIWITTLNGLVIPKKVAVSWRGSQVRRRLRQWKELIKVEGKDTVEMSLISQLGLMGWIL